MKEEVYFRNVLVREKEKMCTALLGLDNWSANLLSNSKICNHCLSKEKQKLLPPYR